MKNPHTSSLAHMTWKCKYHIAFDPKFIRQEIYGKIKQDIGVLLREVAKRKEVEILATEVCKDHIHMHVSLPTKMSVSGFVGYLKGKSTLIIEIHGNLKYKYGNRTFGCREHYVSTVENNKETVRRYVENQIKENIATDNNKRI